MTSIYLLNLTGTNSSGLFDAFIQSFGRYTSISILDIDQAVVYQTISCSLLLQIPPETNPKQVLQEALFQAHNLGLNLEFTAVQEDQYECWVQAQRRKRYIITVLGRYLTTAHLSRISRLIAENNLEITQIKRLSDRQPLVEQANSSSINCIEIHLCGNADNLKYLREQTLNISSEYNIDLGIQEDTPYRRHRRLIAFDMDSTLIQSEVIDELAAAVGKKDQVCQITEKAMRGEIDFKQSLRQRVALLKDLELSVLDHIAENLPLSEGAERLINNLQLLGYKVAVLSGGFNYIGRKLQKKLDIDYLYANELEIKNSRLTGRIVGEIVDGQKKAEYLANIAEKENISLEQVIAVGDGANDLPMLDLAGLGIAFHAKPKVKEGAEQAISNVGLDAVLYFIGLTDREAII